MNHRQIFSEPEANHTSPDQAVGGHDGIARLQREAFDDSVKERACETKRRLLNLLAEAAAAEAEAKARVEQAREHVIYARKPANCAGSNVTSQFMKIVEEVIQLDEDSALRNEVFKDNEFVLSYREKFSHFFSTYEFIVNRNLTENRIS